MWEALPSSVWAAKPILDVDIEIKSLDGFEAIKEKLASVGYHHEGELDIPGREAFKYDHSDFMAHHLYVCASGASELKRHLAFPRSFEDSSARS